MFDIVVSKYNRNVDWANKFREINGIEIRNILIYEKEKPENKYNIPVNKGNEASVYLKYIIDNYENLPEFTFFVHDEEYSWHHGGSLLNKLREAIMSNKLYYNVNDKCILGNIITNEWYNEILEWYNTYIEKYIPMNSLPNKDWTNGHRGSAQFLVHKSIILKLPKDFYLDLYIWIITTNLSSSKSGRFMEWTWHLFWDIYPNL